MASQTPTLETEDALRLFTNAERRQVVEELVAYPEQTVPLQVLTAQIADAPSPSTAGPTQKQALASLTHNHLPRLDELGLIEYDWRSDTVRYHPDARVERLLEFIKTDLE